jgi:II/X family phage/plasmid replication protein
LGDGFHKRPVDPYVLTLADWCDAVGLVRVEMTFKATKLHDMGCHYLGGFDMKQLEIEFEQRSEVLTRGSAEVEDLASLPKALLSTYRMWQAGDDLTSKLSRATFYRHRRQLLPYGVDIAIKSNVIPLKTRTRVIKLGPVSMPDWYELPKRWKNGTHN